MGPNGAEGFRSQHTYVSSGGNNKDNNVDDNHSSDKSKEIKKILMISMTIMINIFYCY